MYAWPWVCHCSQVNVNVNVLENNTADLSWEYYSLPTSTKNGDIILVNKMSIYKLRDLLSKKSEKVDMKDFMKNLFTVFFEKKRNTKRVRVKNINNIQYHYNLLPPSSGSNTVYEIKSK